MQFVAKARYIRFSPYKLRPLADVIRGKSARYALDWVATYPTQRSKPIKKLLESAIANAKDRGNVRPEDLIIGEIRIDQGPIRRYFKPGAMGRSTILRKRQSHVSIVLTSGLATKEENNKSIT